MEVQSHHDRGEEISDNSDRGNDLCWLKSKELTNEGNQLEAR